MEYGDDLLIKAIKVKDVQQIECRLAQGVRINERCGLGTTPLIAAVQTEDLGIVKLLVESSKRRKDVGNGAARRNVGYFVVNRDCEAEMDDVLTPEGMEGLEWDSELGDARISVPSSPESASLYQWYAHILSKTSEILQYREYDMARLDGKGRNALHYAVKQGNLDIIQYLLEECPEVSVHDCDSNSLTPLHIATSNVRFLVTRYLLGKGANVNAYTKHKQTPLHIAATLGSIPIVNLLLEYSAEVNIFDIEEQSPLTKAVVNGHDDIAKLLIRRGTNLNHEDIYDTTVLYHAVWNDMNEIAGDLLDFGAKIMQSQYLLHLAISKQNFEAVKILHRGGAVLTVRDEQGNTPLMTACLNQNFPIAQYLLQNGVSANATSRISGITALHYCIQVIKEEHHFRQFLELLLSHDVNMNASSHYGNIFFYSIVFENITAACVLVQYGADVNRRDEHTHLDSLFLAKKHGNFDLVKLVICAGFDFKNIYNLQNLRDKSAADGIFEFIVYSMNTPRSLRDLCRIQIRTLLGKQLMVKLHQLPLPTLVHKFLALQIL